MVFISCICWVSGQYFIFGASFGCSISTVVCMLALYGQKQCVELTSHRVSKDLGAWTCVSNPSLLFSLMLP